MFPKNIHLYGMELSDNNVLFFLLHFREWSWTNSSQVYMLPLQLACFGVTTALIFESDTVPYRKVRTFGLSL